MSLMCPVKVLAAKFQIDPLQSPCIYCGGRVPQQVLYRTVGSGNTSGPQGVNFQPPPEFVENILLVRFMWIVTFDPKSFRHPKCSRPVFIYRKPGLWAQSDPKVINWSLSIDGSVACACFCMPQCWQCELRTKCPFQAVEQTKTRKHRHRQNTFSLPASRCHS